MNTRRKTERRTIGRTPSGPSSPLSTILRGKDQRKREQLRQSLAAKSNADLESLATDPSSGDLGLIAQQLLDERAAEDRIAQELVGLDTSALASLAQEPDQDFKHRKARKLLQERQLHQLPTLSIPELERVVNEASNAVFTQARALLQERCREQVAGLGRTELAKMALSPEADTLHLEARRLWPGDANEALAVLRPYELKDLDDLLAQHHELQMKVLIQKVIVEKEEAAPTCNIATLLPQSLDVLKATLRTERNKANRTLLREVIRQKEVEAAKAAAEEEVRSYQTMTLTDLHTLCEATADAAKKRRIQRVITQKEDQARKEKMAVMAEKRVKGGIVKFLGRFPKGFTDPMYLRLERDYKWEAHEAWEELLNADEFGKLLKTNKHIEITRRAMRVEAKTHFMLHPMQKMALHDAVKKRGAAKLFAEGLYDLIYGRDSYEVRFGRFAGVLGELPQVKSPVLSWPIQTIFPFLALPEEHIFLKPNVTKAAAKWRGVSLNYRTKPNWLTYSCFLKLAALLKTDLADLKPRDMIDIQSFIWVTEFYDYVATY